MEREGYRERREKKKERRQWREKPKQRPVVNIQVERSKSGRKGR